MKKPRTFYLVIDHSDEFLLPLGLFDSLSAIARSFDVTPACVLFLLREHRISRTLKISIEEVQIDD